MNHLKAWFTELKTWQKVVLGSFALDVAGTYIIAKVQIIIRFYYS